MSADLTSVYFQNMKERIIRILIRGKRKTYTNTESKNQTTNKNTKIVNYAQIITCKLFTLSFSSRLYTPSSVSVTPDCSI